jgi:hypothetical protein
MRQHAILSASAAHRWLMCTPSARLESTLPDTSSIYAEEGTLAHEIAALTLRYRHLSTISKTEYRKHLKKLQQHELYQDDMMQHVNAYLDYINHLDADHDYKPHIAVEVQVAFNQYVPEGFGTADCIIIGGEELHVVDFKYGKGVAVEAENNPQMMLYALGALEKYALLFNTSIVKMTIVQPRLDAISTWGISASDLRDWGEGVRPIAEKAFKGEGVFYPGDHCRFCRASSTCRARAEFYLALEGFQKIQPDLLSNDEIGAILERAQDLQAWIKDLQDYALNQCLSGIDVPGWKAVEGRSVRQWTDADKAFETLVTAGVDEAMLYERKPLTLAATERILGKERFGELVGSYVDRPPGRPTLAPETDKRQAITRPMAKDEFEKIN